MPETTQAVILSGARTPVGKFQGALAPLGAADLGAVAVREAMARAGVGPDQVSEVILGNVIAGGLGQNPARQAALKAGIAPAVAALTVNKVCGSGLKAVMLAAQAVRLGDSEVVVAGGQESMTNAPYYLYKARTGYRMGNGELVDGMIKDGLWCAHQDWHMGNAGELIAERFAIGRDEQDRFALESHRKAIAAQQAGRFDAETVQIVIPGKKGDTVVDRDEGPRADTSLEALGKLKPAFKQGGTVTAGNAVAGTEPKWLFLAPIEAVNKLLARVGWERDEVDLFELNEAFSVQAICNVRELKIDPERVNVNGGAVALGHPIGCSGARVLVTLLHALAARNLKKGVAALCLGGGNAVALAVERY
jgi:acetyl-CoA C-acetyltransferase